jgi:hypothetical protein
MRSGSTRVSPADFKWESAPTREQRRSNDSKVNFGSSKSSKITTIATTCASNGISRPCRTLSRRSVVPLWTPAAWHLWLCAHESDPSFFNGQTGTRKISCILHDLAVYMGSKRSTSPTTVRWSTMAWNRTMQQSQKSVEVAKIRRLQSPSVTMSPLNCFYSCSPRNDEERIPPAARRCEMTFMRLLSLRHWP